MEVRPAYKTKNQILCLKSQTKKEQEQDKYEWEMERFYYHFKAAKTFGPIFIVQIYCRIKAEHSGKLTERKLLLIKCYRHNAAATVVVQRAKVKIFSFEALGILHISSFV